MNVEIDRVSMGIGRDDLVPIAAVLQGSMCFSRREK